MSSKINLEQLTEITELESILDLYQSAATYLVSFEWCKSIINGWYDFGIHEKLGVFLFEIEPDNDSVDSFIWIIAGDIPTVYLDSSVQTGIEALEIYADLMDDWANAIINGKALDECYPVDAESTIDNAKLLLSRTKFIRNEVIPNFK